MDVFCWTLLFGDWLAVVFVPDAPGWKAFMVELACSPCISPPI